MRFLYRSTESKTAHPLAESGASSGLWRVLWGPDLFGAEGPYVTPHHPNGIPDILEEIVGINYFKDNPTDITRYGYTYTTTFDGKTERKIIVKIEREDYEIIPQPRMVPIDLPPDGSRESGEIWGPPQLYDFDPTDNKSDIFVATRNGFIYRITYWRDINGEPKYKVVGDGPYISIPENRRILGAPQLVDIDLDGRVELVFGTSEKGNEVNAIYVYNADDGTIDRDFSHDGKVMLNPSIGVTPGVDVWDEIEIGNLDSDQEMEIVACVTSSREVDKTWMEAAPGNGYVICLEHNGELKWVYERKSVDGYDHCFVAKPEIADVTGDGINEVIVRDGYGDGWSPSSNIYILDGNTGSETSKYYLGRANHASKTCWQTRLGVGDLDNDGDDEIMVTGATKPGEDYEEAWTYILNPTQGAEVSELWIDPRTAVWPEGYSLSAYEYHQHEAPVVIDADGDGLNDSIIFGTCKDAAFVINVDLTTPGLSDEQRYDYDVDNDPTTGDDDGNDFPRGIPGTGDVHGTPAWLNIDSDPEKELIFATMGLHYSPYTPGKIIIADYQDTGEKHDFVAVSEYSLEKSDTYRPSFHVGPTRSDLDNDGLLDILFVTSSHCRPYGGDGGSPSPGDETDFTAQILVWHVFAGAQDEQICYLKITSSAPMLKEGNEYRGKKTVIAHIGVVTRGGQVWIRSKEAVEDVGM
jgi:hypothetical protein